MLTADFLNGVSIPFVLTNDATLGRGATAEVRAALIGDRRFAIKLYKQEHELNEAKILGMCAFGDPSTSDQFEYAWPVGVVKSNNALAGYLMETFDKSKHYPLNYFFDPTFYSRLNSIDIMSLSNRVEIALSLCRAIRALHSHGIYFIDLKPQNILVNWHRNTCVLLDCDGFSFRGPDGTRFPAGHISTDYIAPEATREKLTAVDLGVPQDNYALAVILFQLFNYAQHPFQGISSGVGLQSATNDEYAAAGLYPYGIVPNSLIAPRRGSTHECMPHDLRLLFDRAFVGNPDQRVSPQEWVTYFENLIEKKLLKKCDKRLGALSHVSFQGGHCAECARLAFASEKTIKVPPQVPEPLPPQAQPKDNTFRNIFLYFSLVFFLLILFVNHEERNSTAEASKQDTVTLIPTEEQLNKEKTTSVDTVIKKPVIVKKTAPTLKPFPDDASGLTDSEILTNGIVYINYFPKNCWGSGCRMAVQFPKHFSSSRLKKAALYVFDRCGASNYEISMAQASLKSLGYNLITDGVIGPNTSKALRSFQERQSIEITGNLDIQTSYELGVTVRAFDKRSFKFYRRAATTYFSDNGPVVEFLNVDTRLCFHVGER